MCHHHPSREWAALREELEAEDVTEDEVERVDPEAEPDERLPPIPPSD